jgi:ArsR family transcriptional regulator
VIVSVTSGAPNAASSPAASAPARQPLAVLKAELFKALGHPVRVRVLELLAVADSPVSEMLADTGIEPSTLSTHLAVLRRAGVVTGRRDGSSVVYSLADPAVAGFLAAARTFLLRSLARGSDLLADLESEAGAEPDTLVVVEAGVGTPVGAASISQQPS